MDGRCWRFSDDRLPGGGPARRNGLGPAASGSCRVLAFGPVNGPAGPYRIGIVAAGVLVTPEGPVNCWAGAACS